MSPLLLSAVNGLREGSVQTALSHSPGPHLTLLVPSFRAPPSTRYWCWPAGRSPTAAPILLLRFGWMGEPRPVIHSACRAIRGPLAAVSSGEMCPCPSLFHLRLSAVRLVCQGEVFFVLTCSRLLELPCSSSLESSKPSSLHTLFQTLAPLCQATHSLVHLATSHGSQISFSKLLSLMGPQFG